MALAHRFGTSQVTIRSGPVGARVGRRADAHPWRRAACAERRSAARRQAAAASRRESADRTRRRGAHPRRRDHHPRLRHHDRRDRARASARPTLKSINVITNALEHRRAADRRACGAAHRAGRDPAARIQLPLRPDGGKRARATCRPTGSTWAPTAWTRRSGVMTPHLPEAELNAQHDRDLAAGGGGRRLLQVPAPQHLPHRQGGADAPADHRPRRAGGRGRASCASAAWTCGWCERRTTARRRAAHAVRPARAASAGRTRLAEPRPAAALGHDGGRGRPGCGGRLLQPR